MSYENTTFLSANGKGVVFFVSKTLFRRVQIGLSASEAEALSGISDIRSTADFAADAAALAVFDT